MSSIDNVTVTLKDWHLPYAGKHHYRMNFDLRHRTFRVTTAGTRETRYIVMHPVVAPVLELELDPSQRKRLERQAKSSVEYDIAMNGKEAVDLFCLAHRTYTCVLMDISMPVMDGFEATRCIQAYEGREGQNHVPIIVLSGLASEEAHREAIGSGMDLLLTKPVKLKALGSLLDSVGIINV
mgnify:CR=1 FL=1